MDKNGKKKLFDLYADELKSNILSFWLPRCEDKEFGGYQFLAYYYVSLARTSPEILKRLGLPFDKAYEKALALYRNTHGDK